TRRACCRAGPGQAAHEGHDQLAMTTLAEADMSQRRYRWVDAALVRVAAGGDGLRDVAWPDLDGAAGEPVEQWRAWLAQVWAHEPFAEAVEVASPVLARQVEHACAGHDIPPRQLRRLVLSAAKYL